MLGQHTIYHQLHTLNLQLDILRQLKESFLIFEQFRNFPSEHENPPRHEILDPLIFSSEAQKITTGISMLQKILVAIEGAELSNVKNAVETVKIYSFYVESYFLSEFIKAVQDSSSTISMTKIPLNALLILKKEKRAIEFFLNDHPIFKEFESISFGSKNDLLLGSASLTDSILTIITKINIDSQSYLEIFPLMELLSFVKNRLSEVYLSKISELFQAKGAGVFFQLIERIIFRKIEPFLQKILLIASKSGNSAFLFVADSCYQTCQRGLEEVFQVGTSSLGYHLQFSTQLSYRVSLCLEDLFSSHFKPVALKFREKDSLEHLYRILLGSFHFHKKSNGAISEFFGEPSSPTWTTCECNNKLLIDQREISRYWIRDIPLACVSTDVEFEPDDSTDIKSNLILKSNLNFIVKDSLLILKKSLERSLRLISDATVLGEIFEDFFRIWISIVGHSFLVPILYGLKDYLSSYTTSKNRHFFNLKPITTVFCKLKSICSACIEFQLFFQQKTNNIPTLLLEHLIQDKNKLLAMIEGHINAILFCLLESFLCVFYLVVILDQVKYELSIQTSLEDYSKETNVMQLNSGSTTCIKICKILQEISLSLYDSVGFRNGQLLSKVLILKISRMLARQISSVKISQNGAFLLIKYFFRSCLLVRDLSEYTSALDTFKTGENLSVLQALGKLFIVSPDALVELLKGDPFSSIQKDALKLYVTSRTDYKKACLKLLFR